MKKGTKHSEKAKGEMSLAKMDYIPWNKGLKGILGNHAKPHTKKLKRKLLNQKLSITFGMKTMEAIQQKKVHGL